jgi:hypothetical protein
VLFSATGMRENLKNNAKKSAKMTVIVAVLRYTVVLEGTMCDNVQLTGFTAIARLIASVRHPGAEVHEFDAYLTYNPKLVCQQFIAEMSAQDQVGVCMDAYPHRRRSNEQRASPPRFAPALRSTVAAVFDNSRFCSAPPGPWRRPSSPYRQPRGVRPYRA